jgi:hypothetical protein
MFHFLVTLITGLMQQNDLEGARAVLEQALAVALAAGETFWPAELHRLRGNALWRQGASQPEVVAAFVLAMDLAQQQNAPFLELRASVDLCSFWRAHNQPLAAEQQQAETYQRLAAHFTESELDALCTLLAELG